MPKLNHFEPRLFLPSSKTISKLKLKFKYYILSTITEPSQSFKIVYLINGIVDIHFKTKMVPPYFMLTQ